MQRFWFQLSSSVPCEHNIHNKFLQPLLQTRATINLSALGVFWVAREGGWISVGIVQQPFTRFLSPWGNTSVPSGRLICSAEKVVLQLLFGYIAKITGWKACFAKFMTTGTSFIVYGLRCDVYCAPLLWFCLLLCAIMFILIISRMLLKKCKNPGGSCVETALAVITDWKIS